MGARVVPFLFFLCFPAGYIQSWTRYLKEKVCKQHWNISCCYFRSKPRHISFPEESSENQETPTSPQAPEVPCLCSFSKHSQCIHALVAQVSPCLAPEGWEMWCQALSLEQQCRDAVQPEKSTPPSPHRTTTWSSGLGASSPQLPGACSPKMLWHIYLLWFQIPSLQPMLMLSHCCAPNLLHLQVAGAVLSPSPSSQFASSLSFSPSPSLSSFFWLGADSYTYCQAQHRACSSPFPCCRVMQALESLPGERVILCSHSPPLHPNAGSCFSSFCAFIPHTKKINH